MKESLNSTLVSSIETQQKTEPNRKSIKVLHDLEVQIAEAYVQDIVADRRRV